MEPKLTRLERFIVAAFQREQSVEQIVGSYAEIDREAVDRALRKAVRPGGIGR